MFGAIAELAGIADDLKSAAAASTFTSSSPSPSSTSSPGKLDGGADGAVPDLDMASSSDETEATATNLGFANQIRRASVTLNALLSGASDPMLKPALSMFQSSLASQAASAALAAAAAASSSSSSSSYASSAHPAAPQLTIEIEPWALESAVMSLADNRKRSREAEEQEQEQEYADEDEGTYSCSASEASSSPLPFHLAPQPKTKKAKGGGSSSKAGQKRPRRVMPNSQAVKEAMPKPPPRGTKNPVKEEMYANMEPEAARLEKNRQSAKECRLRKKEYVFNLEKKVAEFEDREVARAAELAAVRSELAQLQREYADALAGRK